jgi:regulator of sigma E protease
MGMCLMALSLAEVWQWAVLILEVALGLGMVIFVHELGHFAVAKWCGVKCEKFYLGFDFFGLRLCRFRWGETEYGIGIFPLGGYVKMLGQDDNPARVHEEHERSLLEGSPTEIDPRSYLAKSVPQRMAIISAGVIMNAIFCFVVSCVAYGLGVDYVRAVICDLVPGDPAWKAGVQIGDEFLVFDGIVEPRFDMDVRARIALADMDHGVDVVIRRTGEAEPLHLNIRPHRLPKNDHPTIGITLVSFSTRLAASRPYLEASAAAASQPALVPQDEIVAVDGRPVASYRDLNVLLTERRDRPVRLTVRRHGDGAQGSSLAGPTEIVVTVPPQRFRHLGVVLAAGPIVALRPDSPAGRAGLRAGDRLVAYNGEPVGDPLTLAERLQRLAPGQIMLEFERKGKKQRVAVQLAANYVFEDSPRPGSPLSIPVLGIALAVEPRVKAVLPGSPAQRAGLKPGQVLASGKFFPGRHEQLAHDKPIDMVFADQERTGSDWPWLHSLLQTSAPGTRVLLQTADGGSYELEPHELRDAHYPLRGLVFEMLLAERKANNVAEALMLGARQATESLTQVPRTIWRLATGQVSMNALGGPVAIAAAGGAAAQVGFSYFLLFLAMLSATLAVLNLLPIAPLDGGHLVLLAVEWVRRKPVGEKVLLPYVWAGVIFVAALMLFVIGKDLMKYLGGWLGG